MSKELIAVAAALGHIEMTGTRLASTAVQQDKEQESTKTNYRFHIWLRFWPWNSVKLSHCGHVLAFKAGKHVILAKKNLLFVLHYSVSFRFR